MRAVRGKQRGTSLIQVGSRAHLRDAVLGACLDWKIPNIPLWTQRFYSLIILILEKLWFVGGQLKRNKLYQFLKVSKGFGEVWLWPKAQWQSGMFPLSIHSWDWVPGVQSVICLVVHRWVPSLSPWSRFPILLPGFPGIQYHINYLLLNLCPRSISGGIQNWIWKERL